jgi:hypothetical protein
MKPTQKHIDAITLALKVLVDRRRQYAAIVKNKYDDDIKTLEEIKEFFEEGLPFEAHLI